MSLEAFKTQSQFTTAEVTFLENLAGLSYALGDILYYDGSKLNRLAIGTTNYVLTVNAGGTLPEWQPNGGGGANTALSNLASVAINTTLVSDTDNTDALGTAAIGWSDLFLGNGAVITFSSAPSTADVTLTHSANTLTLAGGDLALGANNLTMTGSIAATGNRVTKGWFTDIESTNMPTVGGTAILTSLTAPQFTTIELGHASDTTLARVSAGVVSIEGKNIYVAGGTDVALADGGTGASLSDPAANTLMGWDDTDNAVVFITIGANLSYDHSTHTLSSSGGAGGATTALDNLASVAINTSLLPGTSDGAALGSTTKMFSDLFLASGGVINWNNGDVTLTHGSATLTLGGGDLIIGATSTARKIDMRDTDVTHGITTIANTNTWYLVSEISATKGGAFVSGFSDTSDNPAIELRGYMVADPDVGVSAIILDGYAANGTGVQALGATKTVLSIQNNGTNLISVLGSGTLAMGANSITMTGSLAATGARVTKGWFTDVESTNMYTVGGTSLSSTFAGIAQTFYIGTTQVAINRSSAALTLAGITLTTPDIGTPSAGTLTNCTSLPISGLTSSTVTALGVGSIELGHASDTTLARVSAGVVSIEGVNILTVAGGTLTGDITLGENTSIALDPAGSADGKYTGMTITGTAGAALAFGDLIYLDPTDSRWELADANSAAAADGDSRGILGICVLAAAGDGSATKILLSGIVRADTAFPALTINAPVYVSETAGDIVVTEPTTTDAVIRRVGVAITADEIYFNPDTIWYSHT